MGLINLGSNSISKLEVVSLINVSNISQSLLDYYYGNRLQRYYPKLYLGPHNTYGQGWQIDQQDVSISKPTHWPERYQQKIKLSRNGTHSILTMEKYTDKDTYTGRGCFILTPVKTSSYIQLELYLSYNAISALEEVAIMSINNISQNMYEYNLGHRPIKYNPRIMIGKITTLGLDWNDDTSTTPLSHWPESFYVF